VKGDVTKATENIIIHQVNCQSTMGSGVALSIRNAFPKAYKDYMAFSEQARKNKEKLLGQVCMSNVKPDKYVANLFGQEFYGREKKRYTSYDALYDGLVYIHEHAKQYGFSVAIPFGIGSARGGADWDIVYAMIDKIFQGYDVTLYKYVEGKQSQPEKETTSSNQLLKQAIAGYRKAKGEK
jgi:O-acetyl-ADP-ribose deacetylase (regulator of RNase III)